MSKQANLKGKNIVVMGLGVHGGGVGVAKWAAQHKANILVTDLKTRHQLKDSINQLKRFQNIKFRLGQHSSNDFKDIDILVANPIVRQDNKYLQIAKKSGAKIYNDATFFVHYCPCYIIGITGTKGKSTTAALTHHLLKTGKRKVYLGGNIRISPFSFLDKLKPRDLVVLEMSSWQCEGLAYIKESPHVSLITNLGIDHLNTYKSLADYAKAKFLIMKYQSSNDYAIFNKQDKYSQRFVKQTKAKKRFFNLKAGTGNFYKNSYLYYKNKRLLSEMGSPLIGVHNKENILAALAICEIFKIPVVKIKQSLPKFKTLSGRMEYIRTIRNVIYVNDTTATAPVAAMASISSINQPIVLIAGGNDKKLDIDKLAKIICARAIFICLLPGTATDKLIKVFKDKEFIDYQQIETMSQAVKLAQKKALPGDMVLLSPGATSFGSFINEFDRGNKFIRAVKALK